MKTIAVIFGSRSTEHDVSIVTALSAVIKPLELTKKFRVEAVYIAKDGSWYWDEALKDVKLYQSDSLDKFLAKSPKAQLLFDDGLYLVKPARLSPKKLRVDVVFPATHGTHGEDGELMGLLEMANVAYVGCGPVASAIAMDKVLAKQVAQAAGIASTPWRWLYSKDLDKTDIMTFTKDLKFPLFVKPAHLGSSIGISKVDSAKELLNALEVAAHYDDKIIIEQAVANLIEVTLPILGNEELQPALLEKPLTKPEDFFDFDTKYIRGDKTGVKSGGVKGAQGYSELPAKLPPDLYKKAEDSGLSVYRALECSGTARVDMLIDSKTKEVFFNEVNPLPGDLYAHNWAKAGVSNVELVSKLVELAEQRWQSRQAKATSFDTNFLKQF